MSLQKYKQKRNFKKTPEPKSDPLKTGSKNALTFSVQKHAARRLHYDLRLEYKGVLLSWAVPKGPSMNPQDKRLAIHVEDHPLNYRYFEGTIPAGNYGAGTVELWDRGTYDVPNAGTKKEAEEAIQKGLNKGHLEIILHGDKLHGRFDLVYLKQADAKNAWLMIKGNDQYAAEDDHRLPEGEKSEDIENKRQRKHKSSAPMMKHITPMLATLIDKPFNNEEWIFEIKWDGFRALAYKNKKVEIFSRNELSFNQRFPQIVNELQQLHTEDCILDGEIIVVDDKGESHFQLIQNYQKTHEGTPYYYVFDILRNKGEDLIDLPLVERKQILQKLIGASKTHIRYSDHIEGKGVSFFKEAAKQKLEGIIAKRADSSYQFRRSRDWLKIKASLRQEVVIGGYTQPKGSRSHLGALLVGLYEDGQLKYAGHVGGGFTEKLLKDVDGMLKKLRSTTCPFSEIPKANSPVTWVKPKLVCEVSFSEWTNDGQMRHPVFKGMRIDKSSKTVVKEKAVSKEAVMEDSETSNGFKVTHPEKIYWKKDKITKGELVQYYAEMAPYLLPYLKNRPLMMHRYPDGIDGEDFYQKDAPLKPPNFVHTVPIDHDSKQVDYILVQNIKTLMYVVNLGSIELHPFNASIKHLDRPDYAVMDLDPEAISFNAVIEVANTVHDILDGIGAPSFCKTSGATGLHIYIPLKGKYTFEQAQQFVHLIAAAVHARLPKITSLERSPKNRQKKVYLDYLQNRWAQTVVCPYSVRGRPGAPVSTPLDWNEVKKGLEPKEYTIKSVPERVNKKGDPFLPVLKKGANIEAALKKLEKLL
jgi:bifunctional non-homologous end joining protein LigD